MTTGWVKSLQCKSRVLEDVVNRHASSKQYHYHQLIPDSASCRKSAQSLKDVVETKKAKKHKKQKPREPPPQSRRPVPGISEPGLRDQPDRMQSLSSGRRSRAVESFLPALSELPDGHPSRNVVEIIFQTSWTPKKFPGRIEMVLKVQSMTRTLTRFEDYREMLKSRAGSAAGGGEDHARCIADGNEMMRFYCVGSTGAGSTYDTGGGAWTFHGGKGTGLCTFSGSGAAHENAGGGRGRRTMLVCRVIAGRVRKQLGYNSLIEERVGYDSVKGDDGELLVFDSRAILPCFLIIYKL